MTFREALSGSKMVLHDRQLPPKPWIRSSVRPVPRSILFMPYSPCRCEALNEHGLFAGPAVIIQTGVEISAQIYARGCERAAILPKQDLDD